jgi:hypothetical protein
LENDKEIIKKGGRMMEKKNDEDVTILTVFISEEVLRSLEEEESKPTDQYMQKLLNGSIEDHPWEISV